MSRFFPWLRRGVFFLVTLLVLLKLLSSKSGTGESEVSGSHEFFFGWLMLVVLFILLWRFFPRNAGTTSVRGVSITIPPPSWPHPAVIAGFIGPIVFNWLWWATHAESWSVWWNSNRFWPLTIAMIFTAIIAGQKNTVSKLARTTLGALIAISILSGSFSYSRQKLCFFIPSDSTRLLEKEHCKTEPRNNGSTEVSSTSGKVSRNGIAWDWNKSSGPERDTVMLAFPDDTVAWKIAAAESDFTQFWVDPTSGDSTVVKNPQSSAVGIFQIMESQHGRDCGQEGLDIYTTAGNIACAKILMARNPNYSDWESSAEKWQNALDVNPCDPFADLGGMSRMKLVKRDTVVTTGDTSFTRRMSTENLVLNWELIRTRRDFIVRYGYTDPATGQAKVEERAVRKLLCLEQNRLDVYPDWVEFRSLDENKLAVEVSYYQPLNRY